MRADCHCDTALQLLTNDTLRFLPQAQQDLFGINKYLDIAFMAIFVDQEQVKSPPEFFCRVRDLLAKDMQAHADLVQPLLWREQLIAEAPRSQTLLLQAMEGAASLGREGEYLEEYFSKGLRSVGLTWNQANEYAGGCRSKQGLTPAGERLVEHCIELGILVDCAHANSRTFWQVAEIMQNRRKPFIVSHSCCGALHPHVRNLDDEQMLALSAAGGVMGITFVPDFLGGAGNIFALCEHIEYAVELMGSDHVALGSDFDGCVPIAEISSVDKLPLLYRRLAQRGMKEEDIANISGLSVTRLLRQVLPEKGQ